MQLNIEYRNFVIIIRYMRSFQTHAFSRKKNKIKFTIGEKECVLSLRSYRIYVGAIACNRVNIWTDIFVSCWKQHPALLATKDM